ncbi:MAG: beta-N-acetylhexosaminidase [Bacteroidales bacterium]|nr:beta-N-acetylhexosaminidase [Bacteroidales bacterium]
MNYIKFMALTILAYLSLSGFASSKDIEINIIPKPVSVKTYKGHFSITQKTKIFYNFENGHIENIASALNNHLKKFYSFNPLKFSFSNESNKGSIFLKLNTGSKMPKEGYKIEVSKNGVTIEASSPNGLFYGVQTLIQMMPSKADKISEIKLQRVLIDDYPRFEWRGLHLDVCRHFMPKEFVLKYIDYMSMHKLNTFHFHLTEDQGWRIEIKKYPLLTEVGSKREETLIGSGRTSKQYDGVPHSGFYTQEDIKEIVEYAAKRYVNVVPEIEMPGHALAALAAYPHLGCTSGPYKVATRWGVFDDVMCAGKESTFEFIEDVLEEVLNLFPSEYIHIGGDECPKTKWIECPLCQKRIEQEGLKDEHELQSYFIQRAERFLNSKGRKLIGWDEILEGGLAPNAAVMSWRGVEGGIAAAKQSHYVVMTPGSHCYFDHYQADPLTQPLAIGGFTPLEKIYSYEPVPDILSQDEARYIMGAQGNVWTEYMKTTDHVEFMVYPRAAALAEVVWSEKSERDYKEFLKRLQEQVKRYDVYGINYSKTALDK